MELLMLNSLEKVFSEKRPTGSELTALSALINERVSFQLAFCPEEDMTLSAKPLGNGSLALYRVREVPVGLAAFENADDYYLSKEAGMYPDVLEPVAENMHFAKGKWHSIWGEIDLAGAKAGTEQIGIALVSAKEEFGKTFALTVISAALPKQKLVYTNWYHCDGICHYYNVEMFSEEFWRINENFIRTAVRHGMNTILTPLFTPPLDTQVGGERLTCQLVDVKMRGNRYSFGFEKLKRWVALCQKCGIENFEMSHLFTQWGAKHCPKIMATDEKGTEKQIFGWDTPTHSLKYDSFLVQFGKALKKFIFSQGLQEHCYFHISDEPSREQLKGYAIRAAVVRSIFHGFTVIDALSDLSYYKSKVSKQPIPETGLAHYFYGKVPSLWVYYCCGQGKYNLSNRFIAMPGERTRVLGFQLYKYDVKGFLQWGYNFYNTQFSLRAIDPYQVTDAGGKFPAGDAFMVYPGKDGNAVCSIRIKQFYEALQDQRALQLAESLIGREKTVALLERKTQEPISFTAYPHGQQWLLETRESINRAIAENV